MKSTNKIIKCLKKMYRATATTTATIGNKKPYCKVCHDSGKSEKEYTSHWVKDLNGKVICPTLLSLECRCCYQLGHTVKFCPVNLNRKKQEDRIAREAAKGARLAKEEVRLAKEVKKPVNVYDLLDEDDESVDGSVADFEVLDGSVADFEVLDEPKVTTWASIAAMSKETGEAAMEAEPSSLLLHLTKNALVKEKEVKKQVSVAPPPHNKPSIFKYSWADWPSDSEDEDNY
jgi:hypothetical protein